jgi:hypothetical protein
MRACKMEAPLLQRGEDVTEWDAQDKDKIYEYKAQRPFA